MRTARTRARGAPGAGPGGPGRRAAGRRRRAAALLLLAFGAVGLSGCWDRRELNEIAIVVGLGVNWRGGAYHVSAEVVRPRGVEIPGQGAPQAPGQPASSLLLGQGPTFSQALSALAHTSSREVFFPTSTLLLVGEALARQGIDPLLEVVRRQERFRLNQRLLIVRGDPSALFDAQRVTLAETMSTEVRDALRFARITESSAYAPRLYKVLTWEAEPGRAVLAGGLDPKPGAPPGSPDFSLQGAVLARGRFAAWLPRKDTPYALLLLDRYVHGGTVFPCPSGAGRAAAGAGPAPTITLRFRTLHASTRVRPGPAGARLRISVRGAGTVVSESCPPSVSVLQIQAAADAHLAAGLRRVIAWAGGHGLDIFGWGYAIYRRAPRLWAGRYAGHWAADLGRVPYALRVDVQVRRTALAALGSGTGEKP